MPILEIESLKTIHEFIHNRTLLVLDLDNTLVESKSHYGSYQWGNFLIKKALEKGMDINEALDEIIPLWEVAQNHIDSKPIEQEVHLFMESVEQLGALKMALTGRSSVVESVTLELLEKYNISFSNWAHTPFIFDLPYDYSFTKGVFFAGPKNQKGAILNQQLQQLKIKIDRVVFVDDQQYLVEEVKQALLNFPIEYYGVRYSGADKKVSEFDYAQSELERVQLQKN